MELGLKNRVAVVTGSSTGIGKEIAKGLSEQCAGVVICSRKKERIQDTAEELSKFSDTPILPIQTDLRTKEEIDHLMDRAIEKFKRVDILVNNTGGPPPLLLHETQEYQWHDALQLVLMSTIRCCQKTIPYMKKNGWGRIINMTSIAAKQPEERLGLSNTIRAGILGLTKTLANELGQYNILVNAVCPGWTKTKRVDDLLHTIALKSGKTPDEIQKELSKNIPLNRMARAEEIANLVVFLASEKASYITGTTIQADGGYIRSVY
jgi:3-oxoacyl-[acyl-carrier protein] reductase